MKPLNKLGRAVNAINRANGWRIPSPADWRNRYIIPTVLALIHSEVSEALEAFRKHDPKNFNEEIADTMIRCLNLCDGLGIDIDAEIAAKLAKNKTRGFRHGGKKV